MLKKNHFLSIEETGSHSPLFNIKKTNLELSLALSSPINNRKELFSTLPPNSDRNCSVENKIKHIQLIYESSFDKWKYQMLKMKEFIEIMLSTNETFLTFKSIIS